MSLLGKDEIQARQHTSGRVNELKGVRSYVDRSAGGWRRNAGKAGYVNRGDLPAGVRWAGVRASIKAEKRRNGRGAKGGREVNL
jgi:hypothetical protein